LAALAFRGLSLTGAIVVGILASIAFSFSSASLNGALSAWIVENCEQADPTHGFGKVLTRGYLSLYVGELVGGIVGISLFVTGYTVWSYLLGAIVCGLG